MNDEIATFLCVSAASLALQQESADVLSAASHIARPSHTMFLCAMGGCQPYLCVVCHASPKEALVEIIEVFILQSPVDIYTPEVTTNLRLPSTRPIAS